MNVLTIGTKNEAAFFLERSTQTANNNKEADFNNILDDQLDQSSKASHKIADTGNVSQDQYKKDIVSHQQKTTQQVKKSDAQVNNSKIVEDKEAEYSDFKKEALKKIAEILEITVDELEQVIEETGLSFIDLLSNQGLGQLLQQIYQIKDESELLNHSEFLKVFKEIKASVEDIMQSYNLTQEEVEILTTKLDELSQPTNSKPESITILNEGKQQQTNKQESSEQVQIEVVDHRKEDSIKETSNESNDSFEQNNKNGFEQILMQNTSQKVTEFKVNGLDQIIYKEVTTKAVVDQIVTQMKVVLTGESTSMFMKLQPEHLGNIALSITSEQGIVTGNFVAENAAVKEIIEVNLANLKVALQEQGIKVDDIKVEVGDTNQFFHKDDQEKSFEQFTKHKNRKITKVALENLVEEQSEEVNPIQDELNQEKHSVEFSA